MTQVVPAGNEDATPFAFSKLRAYLDSAGPDIGDNLTRLYGYFLRVGAQPAARRLRLLDARYNTLTPETMTRIVEPERTLDEVDEIERAQARNLHDWRNRLALVPLILTWWALTWSTIAYAQQLIADPRLVAQPFLFLWQQRFGGRLFFLCPDFFWTALLDCLLLAGVFTLTWVAQAKDVQVTKAMATLANDLDGALGKLEEVLETQVVLPPDPKGWADAVRRVIERAMRATEEMAQVNKDVLNQTQDTLKAFQSTGQQFMQRLATEQSQLIVNVARQFQEIARDTKSAQDEIAQRNKEALEATKAAMEAAREEITQFVKALANESMRVLEGLQDTMKEDLRNFAGEAAAIIHTAGDALGSVPAELSQYVRQLGEQVEGYRASTAAFAAKVTELGTSTATLTHSAQDFAQSGRSINETLANLDRNQAANATQIAAAATEMRGTAAAMQSLTTQVASDLGPHLNEVAVNAAQASRALAAVNEQVGTAATLIQQAVQRLEKDLAYGIPVRLPLPWPFGRKQRTGMV